MTESLSAFHVNRYDGFGAWLFGIRYQASPLGDRPSLADPSVYARTYRRVMRKAVREFACGAEPIGRYTGNGSDLVGRQVAVATVHVEVIPDA